MCACISLAAAVGIEQNSSLHMVLQRGRCAVVIVATCQGLASSSTCCCQHCVLGCRPTGCTASWLCGLMWAGTNTMTACCCSTPELQQWVQGPAVSIPTYGLSQQASTGVAATVCLLPVHARLPVHAFAMDPSEVVCVCCVHAFLHQLTCCLYMGVFGGSHTSCQSEAPVCCWVPTLLRQSACRLTTPTMVRMPGQLGIKVPGAQHGMHVSVTRSWYMQQHTAQHTSAVSQHELLRMDMHTVHRWGFNTLHKPTHIQHSPQANTYIWRGTPACA